MSSIRTSTTSATATEGNAISFPRQLAQIARERPNATALIEARRDGTERQVSWQELDQQSTQLARLFMERGVKHGSTIVIALPNQLEHFLAAHAAWKCGAMELPISAKLPERERSLLLELAEPALVVGSVEEHYPSLSVDEIACADALSCEPLPERISNPGYAIPSGGSTGRPKIIYYPREWTRIPHADAELAWTGMRSGQVQLVAGPLYHNGPCLRAHFGTFDMHTLVVMEKFDAAHAVDLIERHRVNFAFMVPTMMQRIARLPDIHSRDLSSIESIFHSGGPCPAWVKRAWIDLVGSEHVYEAFGATEGLGGVAIRGDEWLEHPGSVGKPDAPGSLRILDPDGIQLPPGRVGEIFMHAGRDPEECYRYIGAEPARTTADGFASVGDLGWVDDEGYLYLADRQADLILTGGANVYPAEVEAALSEHPDVVDVAVVPVPDDDWGQRVHAIVQLRPNAGTSASVLNVHVRERIAAYKAPKTYEFIDALPRDESGKIRRTALAAERKATAHSSDSV